MLRWRLIGAVAIIVPVLGLLWLDDQSQYNFDHPGIWFATLLVVVGSVCVVELSQLVSRGGHALRTPTTFFVALAGMLIMVLPRLFPLSSGEELNSAIAGWPAIGLATVVALLLIRELFFFKAGQGATERIAMSLLAIFYVLVPFIFMFELRMWSKDNPRLGMMSVVSVIFVAKLADSGAYFAGRNFGKRPMAPVLSPKKTIEGGIGGVIVAMLAGIIFLRLIIPAFVPSYRPATWWGPLGFAASVAVAGMIGDLSVSLFKRDADQKDSGKLLPGLGGGLDVLDSILWAAPVGYLWWICGAL